MKEKCALYPGIMSLCALVCFVAVAVFFSTAVHPPWGRMLLLLLPALVLGLIAWRVWEGKLKQSIAMVVTTVLVVVFFLGSLFYVSLLSVVTATTTSTNPIYYRRAYREVQDGRGVEGVFPAVIPPEAEDVAFSYTPGFLQGGEELELSYTTTEETLTDWVALLEGRSQWVGPNLVWQEEQSWDQKDTGGTRYQLYWDGGFNHGEMSFVLVEEDTCRITFCYAHW